MSGQTLADVIGEHMWSDTYGCDCGTGPMSVEWGAHVEAAVLDWLRARLASDEVREVALGIDPPELGPHSRFMWDRGYNAATAVLAALDGTQDAQNRDLTASEEESGQGDHRDDEGRSGARDGLTCLAAVPPGWPHVPCVRPFKHEGEHSATPRWVDLFGIDPDFTGGQDINEYLDESRGEA